jgi:multidrug resistance efflux pump
MKKIVFYRAAKSRCSSGERSGALALSGGTAIVCPADEAAPRSRSALFSITIIVIALLLSACGSNASPTAIPTVVLDSGNENQPVQVSHSNDGDVVASAIVVPVQEAQLGFSLPGSIKKVSVAAGDQVKAGDLLAELDNASIQLEVEAAERTVRELTSAAAIAAAEQAVAHTQKTYDDAKKKVDGIQNRHADNVTINYLKDQVTLAQNALDYARDAYKQTGGHSDVDPIRAKAATNLYNAQKAYNAALANLNWYANPPSANDVALANADFEAASAALQEAQWYESELKGQSIPSEATGPQLTQLQQARDTLQAAQDRLDQTRLVAPIPGIVVKVDTVAGEYASPGQIVVVVSDTQHLQVKTTDLSERDVTKVQVGAPARVMVDALSQEFDGEVVGISPVATTLGGDVVYEVTISFTEQPEGLLGGMSAEVTIGE